MTPAPLSPPASKEESGLPLEVSSDRVNASHPKLLLRRSAPEYSINDPHSLKIVAQTAATLSHEINNPLMTITGIVERLLAMDAGLTSETREKVRQVGEAAARIRNVTERLMEIDALYFRHTAAGLMIDLERLFQAANSDLARREGKK